MEIRKIGVVGCGIMGSGITQVCARSGYSVLVSDVTDKLLEKGLSALEGFLKRNKLKGKLSPEEKDAILGRIRGTTHLSDFEECDLVIEAVTEDLALKKRVFGELDQICGKNVILASNTSVLSVTEIARATGRPQNIVGMHFFNPANVMRLLEIVQTLVTSDETLHTVKEFGKSLGKVMVVAKDTPGFIVNRLLTPFLLNAIRMVEEGIGTVEDIDTAVKLGLNFPMGALELLDLIGIDTVLRGANAIYEELKEPEYAPPVLMKTMVAAGCHGRKTGKGFFEYIEEKK